MNYEDIAEDAFEALIDVEQRHPLTLLDGTIVSAKALRDAVEDALAQHDIKIFNTQSDRECPLKDDTHTCVDFLSVPSEKRLSVDQGRVKRHHYDRQRLTQQMIHEAFRMAQLDDRNYQYSRDLANLVESYRYNGKNIDWFLNRPVPCASGIGSNETTSQIEKLSLEAQRAARVVATGPIRVDDLIGQKFLAPFSEGLHFEFTQDGPFLVANERFGDGKPYGIYNDLICGRVDSIDLNQKFKCSGATSKIYGDVYLDVEVKKPQGAPLYLDLFLGPHVGARPGWVSGKQR
jgi:hypothetical protein